MTMIPDAIEIRPLGAADAGEYWRVHLRALREHPDAVVAALVAVTGIMRVTRGEFLIVEAWLMDLRKLNPAVDRHWLLLAAGIVWTAVGAMLIAFAYEWLSFVGWRSELALGGAGLLAALAVYRFGFSRLARANGERIVALAGRKCLFSFQIWRSYLVVAFMMALGIALRSSPIPKPYLAVLYLAIGGGLFLSSLEYYRRIPAVAAA